MKKLLTILLAVLLYSQFALGQLAVTTDVLVVGGGAGGTAAGIQSARLGAATIIVEETDWLGGMLSAAGVTATDGNHRLPSGIWNEFREALYKVYGGPNKVFTGWVSNTQFEPHVADSIFKKMASAEKQLNIYYNYRFKKAIKKGNQVIGADFEHKTTGMVLMVTAKQVIDATELGDVLASAKIPADIGMEANSITGENVGVESSNDIIQDLTYAAVLKDYGTGADKTIPKPANYTPAEFDGACTNYYIDKTRPKPSVDAQKMLDYGKLPHGKYMLNWPGYGNDYYINLLHLTTAQRDSALVHAKAQTFRFIYFIQTQLGFKHIGLADDEFSTPDKLPLIPYHRESRRVKGLTRFNLNHIAKPFDFNLYRTGIACGDYPIDHHHRKNPAAPQHLAFYPIPSFNLPLGSLIPATADGIIAAEKNISVSNVVNGTTRLQPCVLTTGQAAGTLAALAVKSKKQARQINARQVQQALLNSKALIMPYIDGGIAHPHFMAIQKIGATGILKGKGIPNAWANQTWFYPDSLVNTEQLRRDFKPFGKVFAAAEHLTIGEAITTIYNTKKQKKYNFSTTNTSRFQQQIAALWSSWQLHDFDRNRAITRAELSVLLDQTIDPFHQKPINHKGDFLH